MVCYCPMYVYVGIECGKKIVDNFSRSIILVKQRYVIVSCYLIYFKLQFFRDLIIAYKIYFEKEVSYIYNKHICFYILELVKKAASLNMT